MNPRENLSTYISVIHHHDVRDGVLNIFTQFSVVLIHDQFLRLKVGIGRDSAL